MTLTSPLPRTSHGYAIHWKMRDQVRLFFYFFTLVTGPKKVLESQAE